VGANDFDSATLTNDLNNDGLADAQEINTYGYVRRTLYVCQTETNLVPFYSSIANAVAAARPRDIIDVITGDYSGENVVLPANLSNITFQGAAFTMASLTVASNAAASFAQTVTCGTLALTGQVAMASGTSLTSTTAYVEGNLTIPGSGAFVVSNLDVGIAGTVNAGTVAQTVTMSGNAAFGGQIISASNMVIVAGPMPRLPSR